MSWKIMDMVIYLCSYLTYYGAPGVTHLYKVVQIPGSPQHVVQYYTCSASVLWKFELVLVDHLADKGF